MLVRLLFYLCGSACLSLLISCTSVERRPTGSLPFHVAVAIPDLHSLRSDGPLLRASDFQLRLREHKLNRILVQALKDSGFSRVSALPLSVDSYTARIQALELATEIGADYLFVSRIDFKPRIEHSATNGFWLGLAFHYPTVTLLTRWLNDRDYQLNVELVGSLQDLQAVMIDQDSMDPNAFHIHANVDQLSLNLWQRTDFANALSFLLPSTLVAVESRRAAKSLEQMVYDSLKQSLSRRLTFYSSDIQSRGRFNLSRLQVSDGPAGMELKGEVILKVVDGGERLDAFQISWGEARHERSEGVFENVHAVDEDTGTAYYEFQVTIPKLPSSSLLRLKFSDAAAERNIRSYSIPIGELHRWN